MAKFSTTKTVHEKINYSKKRDYDTKYDDKVQIIDKKTRWTLKIKEKEKEKEKKLMIIEN